jgi:hypothetical protein
MTKCVGCEHPFINHWDKNGGCNHYRFVEGGDRANKYGFSLDHCRCKAFVDPVEVLTP